MFNGYYPLTKLWSHKRNFYSEGIRWIKDFWCDVIANFINNGFKVPNIYTYPTEELTDVECKKRIKKQIKKLNRIRYSKSFNELFYDFNVQFGEEVDRFD